MCLPYVDFESELVKKPKGLFNLILAPIKHITDPQQETWSSRQCMLPTHRVIPSHPAAFNFYFYFLSLGMAIDPSCQSCFRLDAYFQQITGSTLLNHRRNKFSIIWSSLFMCVHFNLCFAVKSSVEELSSNHSSGVCWLTRIQI